MSVGGDEVNILCCSGVISMRSISQCPDINNPDNYSFVGCVALHSDRRQYHPHANPNQTNTSIKHTHMQILSSKYSVAQPMENSSCYLHFVCSSIAYNLGNIKFDVISPQLLKHEIESIQIISFDSN